MAGRGRVVAALLGAGVAALLAVEVHYFRYAVASCHPPPSPLTAAARADARARLPGLEEVSFTSDDGLALRGWYVPSRNGATVVVGTGLGENRARFVPDASMLARHGYGSLLFDWRAHGESEGDTSTLGDREQRDFAAAVDLVARRPDVVAGRIAGLGFSIGAAAVAMEAARDPRVRAVVLLALWTSLDEETRFKMRSHGALSTWPVLAGLRYAGVDLANVRPLSVLPAIAPRPILFVGGTEDSDTPPWVLDRVFAAASEPKRRWLAVGAEHGEYQHLAPEAYERVVVSFLDDAFFPRPAP